MHDLLDRLLADAPPYPDGYIFVGLPWLSVECRGFLPPVACVYLALDDDDTVLYVGKSRNLLARWRSHHRMPDILRHARPRILWLPVDDEFDDDALGALELWCIGHFRPRYNYTRTVNPWRERFGVVLRALRRAESRNRDLAALLRAYSAD